MITTTTVWATFQVEGWHHWPGAPDKYDWLADSHRHMFHVRVEISVGQSREIEFIDLRKQAMADFENSVLGILATTGKYPASYSCEEMAKLLVTHLELLYPEREFYAVTVSEDGENGSTVEYLHPENIKESE